MTLYKRQRDLRPTPARPDETPQRTAGGPAARRAQHSCRAGSVSPELPHPTLIHPLLDGRVVRRRGRAARDTQSTLGRVARRWLARLEAHLAQDFVSQRDPIFLRPWRDLLQDGCNFLFVPHTQIVPLR